MTITRGGQIYRAILNEVCEHSDCFDIGFGAVIIVENNRDRYLYQF